MADLDAERKSIEAWLASPEAYDEAAARRSNPAWRAREISCGSSRAWKPSGWR
jgi:hypothetical protein